MTVLDARGRMLGRWNIIDVAAVGAVVVMAGVGYGAFRLFRTPTPVVASITPAQIFSQETGTLHVTGEHFRPFLSVRLGSFTAPFLVASPTSAEVNVKDLAPGTHDLVLLDEARELLRIPGAITVLPSRAPPLTQMEMQAVGAFVYLTATDAAQIRTGVTFGGELAAALPASPVAEVMMTLPPEVSTQRLRVSDASIVTTPVPDKVQVPAIVRLRCVVTLDRCRFGGADMIKDALVPLTLSVPPAERFTRAVTQLLFRIDELRPATAPLTFRSDVHPVSMEINAVGDFINLSREDAGRVRTGSRFERPRATPSRGDMDEDVTVANVVAAREPQIGTLQVRVSGGPNGILSSLVPNTWQVPAIIRLRCVVTADQCRVGDASVSQGAIIPFDVPLTASERFTRPTPAVLFRIERLGSVEEPVDFVVHPVSMEIHAVGDFINLSQEDARRVQTGSHFERPRATPGRADVGEDLTVAKVVAAHEPETGTLHVRISDGPNGILSSLVPNTWQVPAIIRLRCVVAGDQCRIGDASVSQGTVITLAGPVSSGDRFTRPAPNVLFRIERLGPVETQVAFPSDAVVRVKFFAKPEVAGLPMAGDEDFGVPVPGGADDARRALRAVIVSVDTEPQTTVATTQVDRSRFQETMATFEVTLHVPVILTSTGWQYAGRPVKVGAPFRFEGRTYAMDGWVLDMQVGGETRSAVR